MQQQVGQRRPQRLIIEEPKCSGGSKGGGGGQGGSRKLWVGGRVRVNKGEALDRGTKFRAGGG